MAKLILPEKTSDLDNIQVGWLNFGNLKTTTFDALEKDELAIQQMLLDFNKIESLEEAQDILKKAKALATESEGRRLYFTNLLKEKVISPSMLFEKRNADLIKTSEQHEFILRKAATVKNEANQLKEREKSSLKAHIENEWFRIAAEYREELKVLVLESYKNALKNKTTVKEIKAYKESIKGFLKDVKVGKFVKFDIKHLDQSEAAEIFKAVRQYEKGIDLAEAIKSIEGVFTMYAEDLKNRTKAMKKASEDIENVEKQTEKEVGIQTAITDLASESVPLIMSGGPTIKKKLEVVEENTADWALAVIRAFLSSLTESREHIRVGSWSKLTIGQMAAAVAKTKTNSPNYKFPELKFKEVEK